MEKMSAWLTTLLQEGAGPTAPLQEANIQLASLEQGELWAWHGAAVIVSSSVLQIDRERLGSPQESTTSDKLQAAFKARSQSALSAGFSLGIDLHIDENTPWETVVSVHQAGAKAGIRTAGLVFAGASDLEPPTCPVLEELVGTSKTDEPPSDDLLSSEAPSPEQKALESCRPAVSILRDIAKRDLGGKERLENYVKRAPLAWQACDCRGDERAVRAIAWYWSGRHHGPPTRTIRISLGVKGEKDTMTVSASKTDPWSKVSQSVIEAAQSNRRLVFAVE